MDRKTVPNTVPWPPLIYGAAVVAAVALNRRIPLSGCIAGGIRPVGAIVMLSGLAFDGSAMLSMRRHHANILPHRAATALVTSGPFSVSRNPIYLGNTLMLAGAALAFDNLWFAGMAAVAARAVTGLAIKREESHLAASFGAAWQDYAGRVPRWFRLLS
ncbi:methyltransferase family protein [Rhodopila sp.]|uniref:methyltransferase family protein n=1 Tax=Rhodopila sp. TaxID=2480087 RepID=UPI003D103730